MPVTSSEIHRTTVTSILKEKEFWLLIVLWLVYCYRPLFGGDTFFFRDICYLFFPQKKLLSDLIGAGEFPFWDAYHHGGHPYLADIVNSTWYPTNLLYLILPVVTAFNLSLILHYMLCSLSTYLFSRILGLQKRSSLIAAVVYGFCGYILSMNDHPTRLFAMALLPLLFTFWHLFLHDRQRHWFILTVIIGMLQVILGAPEVNIITMMSLLGWMLFCPSSSLSFIQRWIAWIALGIFIIGTASFQVFPTLEATFQSSRGEGLQYDMFVQWSLHPIRLLEMVFPAFRGYIDRLPYNVYFWGGDLGDKGYPYFPNIYFGAVALALALIGAFSRQHTPLPSRTKLFLLGLFFLALFLAFGRFWPFFPVLHQHVPLVTLFRYPIKFLLAGLLPFAVLAGSGADRLCNTLSMSSSRRLTIACGIIGVLLIGATLSVLLSESITTHVQRFLFHLPGSEVSHLGIAHSLAQATALWLVFTILVLYKGFSGKAWYKWTLVSLLIVDLLSAGRRVTPLAPKTFFTEEPALAGVVRDELGDGKLYRTADPLPTQFHFPLDDRFQVPPDHVMWLYRWQLETLRKYLPANYNIPVIFHRDYNKMAHRRLVQLTEILEALPWNRRLPVLAAGGVSLVLSAENLTVPGVERVADIPNWSDMPLHLYRHAGAAPRVGFVTHWKTVESDEKALALMLQPGYDPRRHVVLQRPQQESFFDRFSLVGETQIESVVPGSCDEVLAWKVTPLSQTSRSSTYSVSTNCEGYLVFSDLSYPGWTVRVNGEPQPILRANFAFSAIPLQAGEYEIKRSYFPKGLLPGAISSLIFCGFLVLVTYKGKKVLGIEP